jgi:hypothetical protein
VSLRAAINAKCKDCIYDDLCPGTWLKQVEECTLTDCPLWSVRPKTAAGRGPKQARPPGLARYLEAKQTADGVVDALTAES